MGGIHRMRNQSRHRAVRGICMLLCSLVLTGCATSLTGKQEDVQSGNKIEMGNLILSIEKGEVGQEVAPENPEGYYDYYEPHEGYEYYIVSGEAQNTGTTDIYTGNIAAQAVTDDETAEAKIVFLNEDKSELTDTLNAGETRAFMLFMLKQTGDKAPQEFELYYNESFEAGGKKNAYDYKTTVVLDG